MTLKWTDELEARMWAQMLQGQRKTGIPGTPDGPPKPYRRKPAWKPIVLCLALGAGFTTALVIALRGGLPGIGF